MLLGCINKLGKQINSYERALLEDAYKTYVEEGQSEYEASMSALGDYQATILAAQNDFRKQIGLRPVERPIVDEAAIEQKYAGLIDQAKAAAEEKKAQIIADAQKKARANFVSESGKKYQRLLDEITNAEMMSIANEDTLKPAFYSQVERNIEQSPQGKFSKYQAKALFKNAKQEELDWLGIDAFLNDKDSVTKQELLDFVKENQVELQEVEKGKNLPVVLNQHEIERRLAKNHGKIEVSNGVDLTKLYGKYYVTQSALDDDGPEFNTLPEALDYVKESYSVISTSKFSQYTLPGGENYKEMLVVMPLKTRLVNVEGLPEGYSVVRRKDGIDGNMPFSVIDPSGEIVSYGQTEAAALSNYDADAEVKNHAYKSSHWDEPNVLAHIRFDERTDSEGRRTLHVAEFQSDWGQELRKGKAVPDMPFKKSWHELAFKKALRYAVSNNFEAISWDTGETNTERYDLSKQVDTIFTERNADGTFDLRASTKESQSINPDVDIAQKVPVEKLPDYVGKDLAEKIVNQEDDRGVFEGDSLKVGGEGMKGFYDRILPSFANKYVKKFGVRVETGEVNTTSNIKAIEVDEDTEIPRTIPGYEYIKPGDWIIYDKGAPIATYTDEQVSSEGDAIDRYMEDEGITFSSSTPIHIIPITPEMRESVMQGQPLFAVDQEATKRQAYKLLQTLPLNEVIKFVEVSRSADRIRVNGAGAEILRRTLEQREINQGSLETGKSPAKASFMGIFLEPKMLRESIELLRDAYKDAKEAGIEAETLKDLADNLEEAYKVGGKTAIVYVSDRQLPHELLHQALYLGAVEKGLTKRHAEPEKLDNHEAYKLFDKGFFSKFAAYDVKTYMRQLNLSKSQAEEMRKAVLREETAAHIVEILESGDFQKLADLGLSYDTATDYLLTFIESYAKKNWVKGNEKSLEKFREASRYLYDAIETVTERLGQPGDKRNSAQRAVKQADGRSGTADNAGTDAGTEVKEAEGALPAADTDRPAGIAEPRFKADGLQKLSQTPTSLREKGQIPIEDRFYTAVTNAGQQKFAQELLDEGLDKSQDWFERQAEYEQLNEGATVAVGLSLMNTYGAKGDLDSLNEVANKLVPMVTEAAQAVQAMSLVSMFSPETAGSYAAKVYKKKTGKNISQEDFDKARDIAVQSSELIKDEINADALNEIVRDENEQLRKEVEMLENALKLANQGKLEYRIDLKKALKEIEALKKRIEENRQRATSTPKAIREIESHKADLFARIKAKYQVADADIGLMSIFDPELSPTAKRGLAIENPELMSVLESPPLNKEEYQDLVDWSTYIVFNGIEKGLTPEGFFNQLDSLTRNTLDAETIREIHADAVANLQGQTPRGVEFSKKERTKFKMMHYRAAKNWQNREEAFARQAAKSIAPNAAQAKIVEAILTLSEKQDVSNIAVGIAVMRTSQQPEAILKYLQQTEGMTHAEAVRTLNEANNLFEQAKQQIKKEAAERREHFELTDTDLELLAKERKEIAKQKRRLSNEATTFYDSLTRSTGEVVLNTIVNYTRATLINAPTTHLQNIISNIGEQVAEVPVNILAGTIDALIAAKTGQRTVTIDFNGLLEGFKALYGQDEALQNADVESGIRAATNIMKFGDSEDNMAKLQVSESNLAAKRNNLFNRIVDNYINYSFRLLSAEDALFKAFAFRKALEELAMAQAKTEDKTLWRDRKAELLANPLMPLIIQAQEYADEVTFQRDNAVSRKVQQGKRLLGPAGKAVEFIVPFDRTPTNIVLSVLDYSPVGFGRAAIDLYKMIRPEAFTSITDNKKRFEDKYYLGVKEQNEAQQEFLALSPLKQREKVQADLDTLFQRINQRQFARRFSKATVGTSVFMLGVYLASLGLMAGILSPDDDDKEETSEFFKRRKQGIEQRSLDIGVARIVLPQSPALKTMAYGATFYDYLHLAEKQKLGAFGAGMSALYETGADTVFEQPLMDTLRDVYSSRSYMGEKAGAFILPRFMPFGRIVDQIGEITDEKARKRTGYYKPKDKDYWDIQMTGLRNSTLSKIPGLRTYADASTSGVSPEERGEWWRRAIRSIDPFNTRSSVVYDPNLGNKEETIGSQVRGGKITQKNAQDMLRKQLKDGIITNQQYSSQMSDIKDSAVVKKIKTLDATTEEDFKKIEDFVKTLEPKDIPEARNALLEKAKNKAKDKSVKALGDAQRLRIIAGTYLR